jgi:hypothetical protein
MMTLHPHMIEHRQVLLLRSTINLSTKALNVNFLDIHLGFLGLSPATECCHNPRSPLQENLANVVTTSVASPVPKAKRCIWADSNPWERGGTVSLLRGRKYGFIPGRLLSDLCTERGERKWYEIDNWRFSGLMSNIKVTSAFLLSFRSSKKKHSPTRSGHHVSPNLSVSMSCTCRHRCTLSF